MLTIGDRLKSERAKLGLSQPALGEIVGAAKRTVIDWEKGATSPTAAQLAALSEAGVDVLFVVTGVHRELRSALDDVRAATDAANAAGGSAADYLRIQEAEFRRRRESRAVSQPEPALIDRARLGAAIAAVEEGLAETRRKLPPEKRAELILAAYDLMADPEQSRANVIRLVRTAA